MTAAIRNTAAFFRLELADSLRSKWLVGSTLVYAALVAAFVWLGLGESSVLGFTGLSRVVLNLTNGVLLALPLLVLVATSQVVVRARRSGLLEMLLSQPCQRTEWFSGVVASRAAVLVAPLVVAFAGVAIASLWFGAEEGLFAIVGRCLVVSVALVWAFLGIGLWLSSAARTPERAIVLALLVWAVASALHDVALLGALLHFHLPPKLVFVLAAANPSEAARIGILTSVDPELSVLGPVGFWLANSLGAARALLVAVAWPVLLGTLALWRARRNVSRDDLVG